MLCRVTGADAGIRVLLADDHPVVRGGLVALLGSLPGVVVVGQAVAGRTLAGRLGAVLGLARRQARVRAFSAFEIPDVIGPPGTKMTGRWPKAAAPMNRPGTILSQTPR